ncbi:hypothetical protein H0H87_011257 [Tephrocybe sp. NHM501043]|nr:hypothetical protein H0H87_011257 [Tephrocybe sp. NHM501043]
MSCLRKADGSKLALAGSQTIAARTSTLYPFAPVLDGSFLQKRPVEAFKNGNFAKVPVLFGSNTNEGANWSKNIPDPSANTQSPNATETNVYNFLKGQFSTLTRSSFDKAVAALYPLKDYDSSLSLQAQQMYGEMRYICPAVLITGAAFDHGLKAYQFHYDNPDVPSNSNHGADLTAFYSTQPYDKALTAFFVAMREYWTSFAGTLHPSAKDISVDWAAVAKSDGSPRMYLHPGAVALENVSGALSARCAFWRGIAGELNWPTSMDIQQITMDRRDGGGLRSQIKNPSFLGYILADTMQAHRLTETIQATLQADFA